MENKLIPLASNDLLGVASQMRRHLNFVAMIMQQPEADLNGKFPWVFTINSWKFQPHAVPHSPGYLVEIEVSPNQ